MQSPAPLFSQAILWKNKQRFWPILFAYIILFIILSFTMVTNNEYEVFAGIPDQFTYTVFALSGFLSPVIAIVAIITAAAVFSYMHNPTSAAMVNALPYRRLTVFSSNYLSGLLIIMVPLLFFFLCLTGIGLKYHCLDMAALLKWLFIMASLSLLLYSLAVIMGMLTGSIIAQAVFFAIANFIFIGLEALITTFLELFLYGFTGPLYGTGGMLFLEATPVVYGCTLNNNDLQLGVWMVYFLVGILFTWLSWKMYQKRKMENAGDIIAIRQLNPVFKYGVTFCSSLALSFMLMAMFNSENFLLALVFMLLTGLIGYFVAEMLLHKSYRVLRSYKGFIVYACLLVIISISVYYDWYGYASRFPSASADENKIEAIAFSYSGTSYHDRRVLQADKSSVRLNEIPNLPDSIIQTYGTPIGKEKRPYSDEYKYIYNEPRNLTSEQTRLLWSLLPGIYCQDKSIDNILQLHQYLVDNVKTVRNNFRRLTPHNYDANETTDRFYLSFVYRMDNGELQTYYFPVVLPTKPSAEIDREIYTQLKTLAGSQEDRAKKTAAVDLPPDNVSDIIIDMNSLRHMRSVVLSRAETSPGAITIKEDFEPVEIRSEDKEDFMQAVKTDYQTIKNDEILANENCGSFEVIYEDLNLPYSNRFRERELRYDISIYHKQTLDFLHNKNYIPDDIYKVWQEYRSLIDARYSTPKTAKLG